MFLFFNDTATTESYTLSLHDDIPISEAVTIRLPSALTPSRQMPAVCIPVSMRSWGSWDGGSPAHASGIASRSAMPDARSEEHTSELQSRSDLVCRLLLEKKKRDSEGD